VGRVGRGCSGGSAGVVQGVSGRGATGVRKWGVSFEGGGGIVWVCKAKWFGKGVVGGRERCSASVLSTVRTLAQAAQRWRSATRGRRVATGDWRLATGDSPVASGARVKMCVRREE
jgi:hypothetical protein